MALLLPLCGGNMVDVDVDVATHGARNIEANDRFIVY